MPHVLARERLPERDARGGPRPGRQKEAGDLARVGAHRVLPTRLAGVGQPLYADVAAL